MTKALNKRKICENFNSQNKKVKLMKSTDFNIENKYLTTLNHIETKSNEFETYINNNGWVILSGPVGCGKTSFIEFMASKMNKKMYKLQISEDTDAESLRGSCSVNKPGQFVFRDGPLINAMKNGQWLILEDLLMGQPSVFSLIEPLLDSAQSGNIMKIQDPTKVGSEIIAHQDFKIIITIGLIESTNGYICSGKYSKYICNSNTINFDKLSKLDIKTIMQKNFPKVNSQKQYFNEDALLNELSVVSDDNNSRINTSRDYFKFCHRLNQVYGNDFYRLYYQDAYDCFVQHISNLDLRKQMIERLYRIFNINNIDLIEEYSNNIEIECDSLTVGIGRASINRRRDTEYISKTADFARTNQTKRLLESLTRCVQMKEPVLLVSETGCGKTSTIQYLSDLSNRKLYVFNMNQQSDCSDLLGGYKPVKMEVKCNTIRHEFNSLLLEHKDNDKNRQGIKLLETQSNLQFFDFVMKNEEKFLSAMSAEIKEKFIDFLKRVKIIKSDYQKNNGKMSFKFIEGSLVKAIKNGDWVLLDEINLAPAEMLQCLSGLLEDVNGSITLTERGDVQPIERHADFHLFACMNPATDVGKKSLPQGLRNRFSELYLEELTDKNELEIIVKHYANNFDYSHRDLLLDFYLKLKELVSRNQVVDGYENKPQFSLRTLCRALKEAATIMSNRIMKCKPIRAIYEGMSFSFRCQLDDKSRKIFDETFLEVFKSKSCQLIDLQKSINIVLNNEAKKNVVLIEGYPIERGPYYDEDIESKDDFVRGYKVTDNVKKNIHDFARILSATQKLPVLIQGETSVGKTSLILYMAKLLGHCCHRINNHEATDIQEYVGCYTSTSSGVLEFQEGLLAQAMREGHWLILDELNLASTDILEALNRVLDDNRQLFIPETNKLINAHPKFRLFATQNPPGIYGGRKQLSRALRNRFIELHFNPIPDNELVEILHTSCLLPKSRGEKLVNVVHNIQRESRELDTSKGNRNFVSLRDLMRWAKRIVDRDPTDFKEAMLEEGFMLLGGRCRSDAELNIHRENLIKSFYKCDLSFEKFFSFDSAISTCKISKDILAKFYSVESQFDSKLEFTLEFRRLAILLFRAMENNEPALLVGNTGCGKTTICQLVAKILGRNIRIINCHEHVDASHFLGSLKPCNDPRAKQLFRWENGPLIEAMQKGEILLIDEISLAEDSVLERLNSVLETGRKLTLVENGEGSSVEIKAQPGFAIVATMNPGGDFGKKELSPALRNRFTEIWCPSDSWKTSEMGKADWIRVVQRHLSAKLDNETTRLIGEVMVDFCRDLLEVKHKMDNREMSLRDLISWSEFVAKCYDQDNDIYTCIVDGVETIVVDSIQNPQLKKYLMKKLCSLIELKLSDLINIPTGDATMDTETPELTVNECTRTVSMGKYRLSCGRYFQTNTNCDFVFSNSTTAGNTYRLIRSMWSNNTKPLLLEGSPGVGKTSLVTQLARLSGNKVVRINLSKETDADDLLGNFLPVENGKPGEMQWRDGPLLQAIKCQDWILLDEMNLASQSVLESLNSCLDYRHELFIPQINETFKFQSRLFACQNPVSEGGGRKGLPKSFLNRFTQIYMQSLTGEDYLKILCELYKEIDDSTIEMMVTYVEQLRSCVSDKRLFGVKGAPWEFNLRDLCRWCELMITEQNHSKCYEPSYFVQMLFIDRFRTKSDKYEAGLLYNKISGEYNRAQIPLSGRDLRCDITEEDVCLGKVKLSRDRSANGSVEGGICVLLPSQLGFVESMMLAIKQNWVNILVGPSGSGKSSVVRLLAKLMSKQLRSMSMHCDMEVNELLGSFEQDVTSGTFKWVDSLFVDSVKNGHWIVLDKVNSCAASVLDRLNGLLEPNGTLIMTERGLLSNGTIEEISPHRDFRLFITLDPSAFGEISKAMRNRGLEIAFPTEVEPNFHPIEERDMLILMSYLYESVAISDCVKLMRFYKRICCENQVQMNFSFKMLFSAATLMNNGFSLYDSIVSVFCDNQYVDLARNTMLQIAQEMEEDNTMSLDISPRLFELSVDQLLTNPVQLFTMLHHRAIYNIWMDMPSNSSVTPDNQMLSLARIAQYTNWNIPSVTSSSLVDELPHDLQRIIREMTEFTPQLLDPRWKPNWSDYSTQDFTQYDLALVKINCYESANQISNNCNIDQLNSMKLSELKISVVNQMNVEQISYLVSHGKLSKSIIELFPLLNYNIYSIIKQIKALDWSLVRCDQIYALRHIMRVFYAFVSMNQSDKFISNFYYHLLSLCQAVQSQFGVTIDYINEQAVIGDFNCFNKYKLRRQFGHSALLSDERAVKDLQNKFKLERQDDIWCNLNDVKIKEILEKSFVPQIKNDEIIPAIKNDVDCVKFWPVLLNIIHRIIQCSPSIQAAKCKVKKLMETQENTLQLEAIVPRILMKQIGGDDDESNLVNFVVADDVTGFLVNQRDISNFIGSTQIHVDKETQEFSLINTSGPCFIKPRINTMNGDINNCIMTFVTEIYGLQDSLNSNASKRCSLRSIDSRMNQLKFAGELLVSNSEVLASNQSLLYRELKLMKILSDRQANAIKNVQLDDMIRLESHMNTFNSKLEHMWENKVELSFELLGRMWMTWSWIQLQLFAISELLDPQTQIYWDFRYSREEQEILRGEQQLFERYRSETTGVNFQSNYSQDLSNQHHLEHPLITGLNQRIEYLQHKLSNNEFSEQTCNLRPVNDTMFSNIRAVFQSFMINHIDHIRRLTEQTNQEQSLDDQQDHTMDMVSMNIYELMEITLLSDIEVACYPDLLEPLNLALSRCLAGMSMIKQHHTTRKSAQQVVMELFVSFPNTNESQLLDTIINNCDQLINHLETVSGRVLDNTNRVKMQFRLNKIALKLLESLFGNSDPSNHNQQNKLNQYYNCVLRYFQRLWSKFEQDRLKRIELENQYYVHEVDATDHLNDEEQTMLQVLLNVCPDLDSDMTRHGISEMVDKKVFSAAQNVLKIRQRMNTVIPMNSIMTESDVIDTVAISANIFNACNINIRRSPQSLFIDIYQELYGLAGELICGNVSRDNCCDNSVDMYAGHLCALKWQQNNYSDTSSALYDMYKDPAIIDDVKIAIPAIENTYRRIEQLLKEYPEHHVLSTIRTRAYGLLQVTIDRPLSLFINYVEQLIEELRQWQVIAARHLSVMDNIVELEAVLCKWRHKELTLWRQTLSNARKSQSTKISADFFRYFQIIETCISQVHQTGFEAVNLMLQPIVDDVMNSSMGNLTPRLNIIRLLIKIFKNRQIIKSKDCHLNIVVTLLENQMDYYSLLSEIVESHLKLEYDALDKELKGFIKTKKWGNKVPKSTDVNKCHKTVFKYLRKWNAILDRKCQHLFVMKSMDYFEKLEKKVEDIDNSGNDVELLKFTSRIYNDLMSYWRSIKSFRQNNQELEKKGEEYCKSQEDNKEELEKAWRSLVSNLQQRKRNCIMEFLKEMTSHGVMSLQDDKFDTNRAIITHLPSGDVKIPNASSVIRCLGLRNQIDTSDKCVKENTNEVIADLSKFNDVKDKLVRICDNYLCLVTKNTRHINSMRETLSILQEKLDGLVCSLDCVVVLPGNSLEFDGKLGELLSVAKERLKYLEYFIVDVLKNDSFHQSQQPTTDMSNEIQQIQQLISQASAKSQSWFIDKQAYHKFKLVKQVYNKINDLVDAVNMRLINSKEHAPLKYLVKPIIKKKVRGKAQDNDAEQLVGMFEQLRDGLIDKYKSIRGLLETNAVNELNFSNVLDYLSRLGGVFCNKDVEVILGDMFELSSGLDANQLNVLTEINKDEVKHAVADVLRMCKDCLNIVESYHEIMLGGLDSLLSVVDNLMKEGLCKPDDSMWQQLDNKDDSQNNEQLNNFDMAGMGDGEGVNDVSEQIEGENQLEGTKEDQKEMNENEMDDVEDQENGIEMSDDFQGKSHDPLQQDGEEENSGDEEEQLKDLEDEMGNVGDAPELDMNKENWDDEKMEEDEGDNEEENREDDRSGGVRNENQEKKQSNKQANEIEGDGECDGVNKDGDEQEEQEKSEVGDGENDDRNGEEDHEEDHGDGEEDAGDGDGVNDDGNEEKEDAEEPDDYLNDLFDKDNTDMLDGEDTGEASKDEKMDVDEEEQVDNDEINEEPQELDNQNDLEENMDDAIEDTKAAGDLEGLDNDNNNNNMNSNSVCNSSNIQDAKDSSCNGGKGSTDNNDMNASEDNPSDKMNDSAALPNDRTSDERTLADSAEKSKKRQGEILENDVENKRCKRSEVYEHLKDDEEDAMEMHDNATDEQRKLSEKKDEEKHDNEIDEDAMDIDDNGKDNKYFEEDNLEDKRNTEAEMITNNKDEKPMENKENKPQSSAIKMKKVYREGDIEEWPNTDHDARPLCETLRNILEPTKASKLGGAYRSGKRLNMKKIIPYIASDFRKDKIWKRRNRPTEREYQIVFGLDNSESVSHNCSREFYFKSLSIVLSALSYLEVGRIGCIKFGKETKIIKSLCDDNSSSFSYEDGVNLFKEMDFNCTGTRYIKVLEAGLEQCKKARDQGHTAKAQMMIILSDGDPNENLDDKRLIELIREYHNLGIYLLNIILNDKDKSSIFDVEIFDGEEFHKIMDDFPLNFVVLRDSKDMSELFTNVLKQWFELFSRHDRC